MDNLGDSLFRFWNNFHSIKSECELLLRLSLNRIIYINENLIVISEFTCLKYSACQTPRSMISIFKCGCDNFSYFDQKSLYYDITRLLPFQKKWNTVIIVKYI